MEEASDEPHELEQTSRNEMTTLTSLRNPNGGAAGGGGGGPSTAERRLNAETQLARNLGITDSVRERVRTKLIDVQIEDSPVKRGRDRDEQVDNHFSDVGTDFCSYCQRLEGFHLLRVPVRMIQYR